MKKQILFCLTLILFTAACSPGFKTQQSLDLDSTQSLKSDSDTPSDENNGSGNDPSSQDPQIPSKIAEKFTLRESGFVEGLTTDYEGVFETTIQIPYGYILDALSVATRFVAPYACQWRGVEFEKNPASVYSRNEIPCGKLLSNGYKQVAVIDVPETRNEKGSTMTSISAVQLPIWVSRFQYSGVYQERRLDSGQVESISSSPNFGDDISLRFEPNGSTGRIHLCAALPGVEVTTPPQQVRAKASYKALGVKVGESTKFNVTFGKAKFDYARGCLATDIQFDPGSFIPQLKLEVTEKPKVAGAVHWGLDIETTSWWQRMLDEVFSWFRASLLDRVVKLANREVNNYIENDLKTGEWFSKVEGEEALDRLSRQLNQSLVRSMRASGLPLSIEELRKHLYRQCDLIPMMEDLPIDASVLCRRAVDSVNLGFIPFHRDANMQAAGCYSSFANIHQTRHSNGQYKTWAENCKFSLKLQAQIKAGLTAQEKQMLSKLFTSFQKFSTWMELLKNELNLGEDQEQILLLVLHEASKREEKISNPDDVLRLVKKYLPMVQSQFYSWLASDLKFNVPL